MITISTIVLFVVAASVSGEIETVSEQDRKEAREFLQKYEYMNSPMADHLARVTNSTDKFKSAVESFQRMAGIEMNGVLTKATMDEMKKPRCGLPDMASMGSIAKRKRRYLAAGKWTKTDLTYNYTNPTRPTTDLAVTETKKAIADAFKLWTDVAGLRITESEDKMADIEVAFTAGDHKDGSPFDGPSRVLAHAFFPQNGGDIHFDEAETWTTDGRTGTDLLFVATHELGHSLGLGHSDVRNAIMYPTYLGYRANLNLHEDDIAGIRQIYGPALPLSQSTNQASTTPRVITSDWCTTTNLKLDAILSINTSIYAFRGSQCAMLDRQGIAPGCPKEISVTWPELPSNLDAAISWGSNLVSPVLNQTRGASTVGFFKGSQFWLYYTSRSERGNSFTLAPGYPKSISAVFPGIPNNLDSAFVWSKNGKTYFTKGNVYYGFYYHGSANQRAYSRPLTSAWQGLPSSIDAAFNSPDPKRTYFFKNSDYYRMNDMTMKVDDGYPRKIATTWLGCPGSVHDQSNMDKEIKEEDAQFMDSEMLPNRDAQAGVSILRPLISVSLIVVGATQLLSMLQ